MVASPSKSRSKMKITKIIADKPRVALPAIADVRGAFTILSSKDIDSSCANFDGIHGEDQIIKGEYTCQGDTETTTSGNDGTSTSSGSSRSSSGAANPMLIPGTTGLLGVFAAMFGLL
jgi:hypothetical protein